jgi:hypothetical protein
MAIRGYFINDYCGYYSNGYWWLVILLMAIGGWVFY